MGSSRLWSPAGIRRTANRSEREHTMNGPPATEASTAVVRQSTGRHGVRAGFPGLVCKLEPALADVTGAIADAAPLRRTAVSTGLHLSDSITTSSPRANGDEPG
ncbi:hypothetical protein F7725_016485 [Dissostichus mawsoni]|uniref:Uncharacterized protein n=1 Tax=Dissostichus mawsoni TaxID=36200 RepID=A0A7J5Z1R4_DISMA|nr:hypothetical protein F7725_016485 [Dissostichus mawsoni]